MTEATPQYHRTDSGITTMPLAPAAPPLEPIDTTTLMDEARRAQIEDLHEQLEAANARADEAERLAEEQIAKARTEAIMPDKEPAKANPVETKPAALPHYELATQLVLATNASAESLLGEVKRRGPVERAGWMASLLEVAERLEQDAANLRESHRRARAAAELLR